LTELHYHEFADAISVWSIAAFLYEYDSATACGARQHGSQSHCAAKGIVPIARARQERKTIGSPIAADKCSKIKEQIDKAAFLDGPLVARKCANLIRLPTAASFFAGSH
jgi:hypothetical protein